MAGYLDDVRVEPALRHGLLEFLGCAAEATFDIERGRHDRGLLPALHEALARTYHSVHAYVDADDPDVRATATAATVSYARCAPLLDKRPVLVALLRRRIAAPIHPHRCVVAGVHGEHVRTSISANHGARKPAAARLSG